MRLRFVPLSALLLASGLLAAGQQKAPSAPAPATPTAVLHTGTQLVIEDVVVEDAGGHPVHGLTRDSFTVTEQKQPQTIRNFEEHRADMPVKPGRALSPLPPGVFTDYTAVPPNGTLNVLLLDTLNTPMTDQIFVRDQLLNFIKGEKPGTRIAIFGLTTRLYILQGFTSDPQVLKNALEHLKSGSSPLLDRPVGVNSDEDKLSDALAEANGSQDPSVMESIASLKQMDADVEAQKTVLRVDYTIAAFNAIGHYLANFPGRKNLIWFSGAFPLVINPGVPFHEQTKDVEFHEMASLLAQAQVAVYPIDARGLMAPPMLDASQSGKQFLGNPSVFNAALTSFSGDLSDTHSTMDTIAGDTGGKAVYNTNGTADAISRALDDGANYYTLTYDPGPHKWDGAFRTIHVELTGAAKARGLHLSYRPGYFAGDPEHPGKHMEPATPSSPPGAPPVNRAAEMYRRAAFSRGAPAPQDILFKVRVSPVSASTEDTLAPGNVPDHSGKMKGPYRRYAVDYVAVTRDFSLTSQPDGRRIGKMLFSALVYDGDGNLLDDASRGITLDLTPESYKHLSPGVNFHLEVSVPARQPSFLRLIVQDVPANRFGVVEIPTAEVSHLTPLTEPTAAASANPARKQ